MFNNSTLRPEQTLADLAATFAGASRVFHRHGLDFCCHGQVSMSEACSRKGLDPQTILQELSQEAASTRDFQSWGERPLPELIEHILSSFHTPHREELPRLVMMARKLEQVHRERPDCPQGLAKHLELMMESLEMHMQKEEQVLFPAIMHGAGRAMRAPVSAMESEHEDHGRNLARLRELAQDFKAPMDACGTWLALYLGLEEFEHDIMTHIHLENNVLFPRALHE